MRESSLIRERNDKEKVQGGLFIALNLLFF